MKANPKLIFFDIDGTLLTGNHLVPESTTKALELLHQNGHVCIINTGRPYACLDKVIKSIKVDGYVCGCGTYIRMGDEILMAHHIEKEMCRKIIFALEDCKIEWMLEGEKALYYSDKQYESFIGTEGPKLANQIPGNIHCISEKEYPNVMFDKFIMAPVKGSNFEKFHDEFKDVLTFIDRGGFYELVPKDYSKASGMKFLEDFLKIPHENTIAVGDSSNDIPMLEYAQTGILMGGTDPNLHKYADLITSSINDDGIYKAFKKLQLI